MCGIYETEMFIDFITSKATFETLNCGAMILNQAYIIIHSYNGSWCLTCKRTAEQSNSLIKYRMALISYILFFTLDFFFVLNHVVREHIMGNFVLLFNSQKIKGLMIQPPAISESLTLKYVCSVQECYFRCFNRPEIWRVEGPVSPPEDE